MQQHQEKRRGGDKEVVSQVAKGRSDKNGRKKDRKTQRKRDETEKGRVLRETKWRKKPEQ